MHLYHSRNEGAATKLRDCRVPRNVRADTSVDGAARSHQSQTDGHPNGEGQSSRVDGQSHGSSTTLVSLGQCSYNATGI